MNKNYIEAFVKYNDKPIEKDWITMFMSISIIVFYVGVYFSEHKIVSGIICSLINIAIIIFYIYMNKNINLNTKNKQLFYGVILSTTSLSSIYLAFILLIKVWQYPIILFLILLFVILISLGIVFLYIKNKIVKGKYIQGNRGNGEFQKIIITIIVGPAIFWFGFNEQYLTEPYVYIIMGILLSIIGVLLSLSALYLFIKYYYLNLLE